MPISIRCQCGAAFSAPDALAGRRVKCPKCAQPVAVPGEGAAAPPAASTAPTVVKCGCGKAIKVPARAAGKAVQCPSCGKPLRTPAPAAVVGARVPTAGDAGGIGDLLDEVDLGRSQTGRRCPECRTDVALDDVLCVKCGFNLETGKKMSTKTVESAHRVGNVMLHGTSSQKGEAKAAPPKPVLSLAKLLNQAGAIGLLIAIAFVAFRGYQATQAQPTAGLDALIEALIAVGPTAIGLTLVLFVVPCAVAANLVQSGKAAGRILSMIMGIAAVPILLGVLIIKLTLTDEVVRHCR